MSGKPRIELVTRDVAAAVHDGRPLDALPQIVDALHAGCIDAGFEQVAALAELAAQARQAACDHVLSLEFSIAVGDRNMLAGAPMPGCLLIQPPMIGAEARAIRLDAERARVAAIVLAREPLMRDGRWPVVASGAGVAWPDERRGPPGGATVRARIDPPVPVTRVDASPTKDEAPTPAPAWFSEAVAALDESALAMIDDAPAAHRARRLVELIEAHPTGTALYQALAAACKDAVDEPDPGPRQVKRSTSF